MADQAQQDQGVIDLTGSDDEWFPGDLSHLSAEQRAAFSAAREAELPRRREYMSDQDYHTSLAIDRTRTNADADYEAYLNRTGVYQGLFRPRYGEWLYWPEQGRPPAARFRRTVKALPTTILGVPHPGLRQGRQQVALALYALAQVERRIARGGFGSENRPAPNDMLMRFLARAEEDVFNLSGEQIRDPEFLGTPQTDSALLWRLIDAIRFLLQIIPRGHAVIVMEAAAAFEDESEEEEREPIDPNDLPIRRLVAADLDEDGEFHDGICEVPIPVGAPVVVTCANNHVFHDGCIRPWLEDGNVTCPRCREPIVVVEE